LPLPSLIFFFRLIQVNPNITNIQQINSNSIKLEWDVENRIIFNLAKYQLRISSDFVNGWPGWSLKI
jgi:hypothetical protein